MKVITICLALIASVTATTLKCEFTRNTVFGYVCEIRGVDLVSYNDDVNITGDHVKGKTDSDVKMISFGKSTVNFVPNKIFSIFPSLEILDLNDVKMTKWNRDFVKNAKSLKRIWLSQNDLEEIEDNSFLGATALEILTLHNNKIAKISDKAFNGLFQLKSLELQENALTTLNGGVFKQLKKLKELNLSENQIVKIDENVFSANDKLEFLNMGVNNISELPANVFKSQESLTVVFVQNNLLETLPEDLFAKCPALMELRVDNNQIKELPKKIFENNKKFKLLNLMNNQIEKFNGKILPEGMELLYVDDSVVTENIPEKLEVFKGEKPNAAHWKQPEPDTEFTTADK